MSGREGRGRGSIGEERAARHYQPDELLVVYLHVTADSIDPFGLDGFNQIVDPAARPYGAGQRPTGP
jgi:hypothetical protein